MRENRELIWRLVGVFFVYYVSQSIVYPTWFDFVVCLILMGYMVKKPLLELWNEVLYGGEEFDEE